jgi:hypothetical protein
MFVVNIVLSGRGLCEELITCPKESYRLWCVVVCDLEKLVNKEISPGPLVAVGPKVNQNLPGKVNLID